MKIVRTNVERLYNIAIDIAEPFETAEITCSEIHKKGVTIIYLELLFTDGQKVMVGDHDADILYILDEFKRQLYSKYHKKLKRLIPNS